MFRSLVFCLAASCASASFAVTTQISLPGTELGQIFIESPDELGLPETGTSYCTTIAGQDADCASAVYTERLDVFDGFSVTSVVTSEKPITYADYSVQGIGPFNASLTVTMTDVDTGETLATFVNGWQGASYFDFDPFLYRLALTFTFDFDGAPVGDNDLTLWAVSVSSVPEPGAALLLAGGLLGLALKRRQAQPDQLANA